MERDRAVDRVLAILDTIEQEPLPVPVNEVWVFGDLALGLDPVERINLYLAKDMLYTSEDRDPTIGEQFLNEYGIDGVGSTVSPTWARQYPQHLRANANGYAAPEQCLAAQLLERDEPIHLEVCNAGFEQTITQRITGAAAREAWDELLDPRGVCLWLEGRRSEQAPKKLRSGEYVFPTLPEALAMIGLEEARAETAAAAFQTWRASQEGVTVRGEVI